MATSVDGSPARASAPVPAVSRGFGSYLFRATIVNWLSSLLTIVYAIFITPIVIKALDKELYGVWSFLNGLLAYSSLFYLGLGAAFIKYLSQYRAAGNRPAVNRLASVVLVLYGTIGLGCLILCVALAPHMPDLLATPLQPAARRQTITAFGLLGSRLLFMFVATVFSGVLIAEERITVAARVNIVATIARFIAVPLLLGHGAPLVTLAVIMSVSAGAEAFALMASALHFVPTLRVTAVLPRLPELRLLYGFGFKSFFIDLSAWLINYTDIVVIGMLIGAGGVAVYSLPLQLVTYGRVVVQGMMSALLPRLTAYETTGDRAVLASAYVRVSGLANYVAAFIAFNLIALGTPFLRLWVGNEFADASWAILVLLALASYCQAVSTQCPVPFFQAMHTLRPPVVVLSLEAVINLGLSLWLARTLGVTGVAVATFVPALLVSSLLLPASLCRKLRIQPWRLFTSAILPSLCLLAAGVLANILLDRVIEPSSYVLLGVRGTANVALAVAGAFVLLPEEELSIVYGWMKRITGPR